MYSTIFDLKKNHTPINSTAQKVIQKGFSEEFIVPNHIFHSKIPPKTCTPPKEISNLLGKKYGSIRVIGYLRTFIKNKKEHYQKKTFENCRVKEDGRGGFIISSKKKSNTPKAHWLVQCACGKYETRTSKSIKKGSIDDACHECQHLKYLKNKGFDNGHN